MIKWGGGWKQMISFSGNFDYVSPVRPKTKKQKTKPKQQNFGKISPFYEMGWGLHILNDALKTSQHLLFTVLFYTFWYLHVYRALSFDQHQVTFKGTFLHLYYKCFKQDLLPTEMSDFFITHYNKQIIKLRFVCYKPGFSKKDIQ